MKQFNVTTMTPRIRRVTFANPPVNLVGADTLTELSEIVDNLSNDEQVQVVIVDSATPGYFLNHADSEQFAELLAMNGPSGTPIFIDLSTRLASAPLEVFLTNQDYDADRAERYGWVTRTMPDAELDGFVDALAAHIASFDKQAQHVVKTQVDRATLPPQEDMLASSAEFTRAVTWPGFQARLPLIGRLIADIGIDELEWNLGHYLGAGADRSPA